MYYKIIVASQRYHKSEPLVYNFNEMLTIGSVVEIPLQKNSALGIVISTTKKPNFATKSIINVVIASAISKQNLELMEWMGNYYPSPGGLLCSIFVPSYLLGSGDNKNEYSSKDDVPNLHKQPPLTNEQNVAIKEIISTSSHSVVLHGETGSGKTRVYQELAMINIARGESVVILTPEIGLTTQLIEYFTNYFGNKVILLHSGMTIKQRRSAWLEIGQRDDPVLIIGPRSALFAPIKNIGLIVIDEVHDTAYKQEQAPHYMTSRVAAKLAELHKGILVMGSATPPVADYYLFKERKLPIISMDRLASGDNFKTKTEIIDLKHFDKFTKSKWLSNVLVESINESLSKGEQSLLFLNRRGSARIILCSICGWQATCPRCDLPLTYHGDTHQSICHTCGYVEKTKTSCQNCGSQEILFKSAGTKAIVKEIERLFPKASVMRFDSDLKKNERLQSQYSEIKNGRVDIIVGTQMISKGLDLPNLSVLGVILADTSLTFPDFTSEERTYQMINQVIGRVGRGHRDSKVIIQTYNPESNVIKQAIDKNYTAFYDNQITERKKYGFPPFCYLMKISCSRRSRESAKLAISKIEKSIRKVSPNLEIIGPSPAFNEKTGNNYRWQMVIKAKKRAALTSIIPFIGNNCVYDIDPQHLL